MILIEKSRVEETQLPEEIVFEPHHNISVKLSPTIRQHANDLALKQQVSLNYFINLAITEKMMRLKRVQELQQSM